MGRGGGYRLRHAPLFANESLFRRLPLHLASDVQTDDKDSAKSEDDDIEPGQHSVPEPKHTVIEYGIEAEVCEEHEGADHREE